MRHIEIHNLTHPSPRSISAAYCRSFTSRFRGMMFQKIIRLHEGILLADSLESKANTTIHMFFMNFDIAAIWINSQYTVVDMKLARRWHPYYAPAFPAQYILETHPDHLRDFYIGDHLGFIYV